MRKAWEYGILLAGISAGSICWFDEGVALHYIDDYLHRIVSSRPNSRAYSVYLDKEVKETELKTKYLGDLHD